MKLRGRTAPCEHISEMQAGRPGARIEMVSGVDLHHNVVRFLWRLVHANGGFGDTSIEPSLRPREIPGLVQVHRSIV